jgi:hypothetical protein
VILFALAKFVRIAWMSESNRQLETATLGYEPADPLAQVPVVVYEIA